jgi:hypothetical protein
MLPIPTTPPNSGNLFSLCFNAEWEGYVLGLLKQGLSDDFWGDNAPADLDQAEQWLSDLLASIDYGCSLVDTTPFVCPQNLLASDHGWAIYSPYGTWGAGDGWSAVTVGSVGYAFLGGPVFTGNVNITRLEIDGDWSNLPHVSGDNDVIKPFKYIGGNLIGIGALTAVEDGFHTYAWDALGSVPNIYINMSGERPGTARILAIRLFSDGDPGVDCT